MATAKARAPGFPAEAGLTRVAAIAGVVVAALALQTTLLARLTLIGVIPQLVLVVVVSLAYLDGESVGVVTGFAGGLLIDLTSLQSIVGLTALVYTLIGFGVGYLRQFATGESVWTPVFAVALASAIAEGSYALMSIILGQPWVGIGFTAKVMGLVTLYNTLLTPFTFPLVRRVADRFRPERVYRW
ncbi:MAG: rod shape-determining protein MreD [Actinomycetota bacterium]